MIRCVVVDDQAMVRDGFGAIISAQVDMAVVGEASNGREAVQVCREVAPDVVLMDVRMPLMDGIEATRLIIGLGNSDVRVLILTTFDLDDYVYEALRAGASGFLLKDAPATDLLHAITVVAAGEALLAPSVTCRLIEDFTRARVDGRPIARQLDILTPRELEILTLIAQGLSNAEISSRLYIAEQTTKTHVGRVLSKLGIRDRAQAVIVAYESGLISPRS